jgi:YVTN family beta-propeller protein
MRAGAMTARRAVLRRLVMPAAAISFAAGLGMVPAPHAVADAARVAGSLGSPTVPGTPVTAYAVNQGSDTVTPIATATDTAGRPITVGSRPWAIAITPDGKTAYVANTSADMVTPIATATNTAGRPITVGN